MQTYKNIFIILLIIDLIATVIINLLSRGQSSVLPLITIILGYLAVISTNTIHYSMYIAVSIVNMIVNLLLIILVIFGVAILTENSTLVSLFYIIGFLILIENGVMIYLAYKLRDNNTIAKSSDIEYGNL